MIIGFTPKMTPAQKAAHDYANELWRQECNRQADKFQLGHYREVLAEKLASTSLAREG